MSYPVDIQQKAKSLRRKGYSLTEISSQFNISKSTASLWCSSIQLDKFAQAQLLEKKILGRYKSMQTATKKREKEERERVLEVSKMVSNIKISKEMAKLCCALLFWCEGNKSKTIVRFTNSDPTLIKLFLSLLRNAYELNESKFRALVHIHEYHDDSVQKLFWSKLTNISLNQFYRSYRKANTGKRKHDNYPGCISITYYDAKVAKELTTIYNVFTQGGVG